MAKKIKRKDWLLFLLIIFGVAIFAYMRISSLEETDSLNYQIKKFDALAEKGVDNLELANEYGGYAEDYYKMASDNYDYRLFIETISNCERARPSYSKASQAYNDAEALFIEANAISPNEDYMKLSNIFIKLSNSGSKLMLYMYEACEYFETACTKYNLYEETLIERYAYEGDDSIEEMNKKIKAHDNEVIYYNKYLAEGRALVKSMEIDYLLLGSEL